ncbi:MAG: hypothetical protein AB8H79_27010 [Myxococcota bacterium]
MRGTSAFLAIGCFVWTGCPEAATATFEQCELVVSLDAETAAAGDTITATGRPYTEALDTVVRVGASDAPSVDVDITASECATCNTCRSAEACGVCETCGACAEACDPCVQNITFEVPSLDAGPTTVTVFNAYGASAPLPLEIVEDDAE